MKRAVKHGKITGGAFKGLTYSVLFTEIKRPLSYYTIKAFPVFFK